MFSARVLLPRTCRAKHLQKSNKGSNASETSELNNSLQLFLDFDNYPVIHRHFLDSFLEKWFKLHLQFFLLFLNKFLHIQTASLHLGPPPSSDNHYTG